MKNHHLRLPCCRIPPPPTPEGRRPDWEGELDNAFWHQTNVELCAAEICNGLKVKERCQYYWHRSFSPNDFHGYAMMKKQFRFLRIQFMQKVTQKGKSMLKYNLIQTCQGHWSAFCSRVIRQVKLLSNIGYALWNIL